MSTNWNNQHQDALHYMTKDIISYIKKFPGVTHASLSSSYHTSNLESIYSENFPNRDDLIEITKRKQNVPMPCSAQESLCTLSEIENWEKENEPYKLPQDLKEFYTVTNGLTLQWFVESLDINDDGRLLPMSSSSTRNDERTEKRDVSDQEIVGYCRICTIQELIPVPQSSLTKRNVVDLTNGSTSSEINETSSPINNFAVIQGFVLENIPYYGKVVLFYGDPNHSFHGLDHNLKHACGTIPGASKDMKEHKSSSRFCSSSFSSNPDTSRDSQCDPQPSKSHDKRKYKKKFHDPTIWFFDDRYHQWSFLTDNFSCYFRLMLVHLGILGWQYAFVKKCIQNINQESILDINSLNIDPRCRYFMQCYAPERLVINIAKCHELYT